MLLFWPFFGTFAGDFPAFVVVLVFFFGTFAGDFPAFVAVLVFFWNILRSFFSGFYRSSNPAYLIFKVILLSLRII